MNPYDQWNAKKKILSEKNHYKYFREREIFYCYLGKNLGHEQDGKGDDFLRPVIILKKFNNRLFLGIPVTSQSKTGKYYFEIKINSTANFAILSQIRLLDSKRLKYKIGKVSTKNFLELRKKFLKLII